MNSKETANLIHYSRKRKGVSQKKLGEMTGISHQIISRYEKGAEVPTEEKLQLILCVLGIEYEKINDYKREIEKIFNKFFDETFYRKANYLKYLDIIKKSKEKFSQTYNYYKIEIIELVCNILINDFEDIETKFSNIEKLDIDDLEALQIYNEYKGYYYLKRKNTKEGLEYLEKAKLMRFHEKTIAMIHYHMSFAYNYEWLRKTDAEYLLDAKNVFQKYYSLKRVSDCEMILGNYYSTFRNFQKASICYENRLRLLEVLGENKINQAKTISTIAYIYIQQKQYDKALKELDKAIVLNQKYIRIHLDYIWCYYKLGDINNANRWIVKMDHFQLDRELKMLWNLYEMIVAQYDKIPNDRLIEKAIKVYKYYKNQEDLDLSIFYIDIVIELLEKRKDYEKGFFYQKEKIFLLENV